MRISVNTILDAGLLANGKLPDIYWELNLTNSEMKILRYVYNNCLRLYKDLKYFPRGKDGSPRFWRGKERMADDCGLSYTGFRNGVRHLFELGLTTSMEGIEDDKEPYCIGLSSKFLEGYTASNQNVKSLRSHSLIDIIRLIYDSITVDIIENSIKYPLVTNVTKLCESQEIDDNTAPTENSCSKATKPVKVIRTPIKVGRTPIKVERTPIITSPDKSLVVKSAKQTLKLLTNIRTPQENKMLEIASYYEYKCRQAIHSTGFKCLGKDFRNHKNWIFLERIYKLCEENDWDYKVYIDSQFDRVKYWNRKQKYPYLNQFNSENAIKYYKNYIKNYKETRSVTGNIKVKTEKVKSVKKQLIDDTIKDCEKISDYIEREKKRRNNRGLTEQQIKMLFLADHWMCLSASYLSSIPWFLNYLNMLPEETFVTELKQEIQAIRSNKKLFSLTLEIVSKVEAQMELPATICLESS